LYQILSQGGSLHRTLYEHYAIKVQFAISDFLPYIVSTRWPCEYLRWERHNRHRLWSSEILRGRRYLKTIKLLIFLYLLKQQNSGRIKYSTFTLTTLIYEPLLLGMQKDV